MDQQSAGSPFLAEAVETLRAGRHSRSNRIGIVGRVNLCCLCGWLDESLLRWLDLKIVFHQPQPFAAILKPKRPDLLVIELNVAGRVG